MTQNIKMSFITKLRWGGGDYKLQSDVNLIALSQPVTETCPSEISFSESHLIPKF